MMFNNGSGMGWVMWPVMGSGALAFWLVVIVVIRSLLPERSTKDSSAPQTDPLTLLRESLARGEVSVEEYEQRRRILSDAH